MRSTSRDLIASPTQTGSLAQKCISQVLGMILRSLKKDVPKCTSLRLLKRKWQRTDRRKEAELILPWCSFSWPYCWLSSVHWKSLCLTNKSEDRIVLLFSRDEQDVIPSNKTLSVIVLDRAIDNLYRRELERKDKKPLQCFPVQDSCSRQEW
jgi:hypothetical protein